MRRPEEWEEEGRVGRSLVLWLAQCFLAGVSARLRFLSVCRSSEASRHPTVGTTRPLTISAFSPSQHHNKHPAPLHLTLSTAP